MRLGKYAVYILGLLLRTCASFVVWHPNLENMLSHGSTMFYLVLNKKL